MGSTTVPTTDVNDAVRAPAWNPWRRLAAVCMAAAIAADVGLMAVHGEIVPPLVVFAGVGLAGALLLRRDGKLGPALVTLAALVPLMVGAPLFLPGLAHPASAADFLHGVATLLFRGAALAAGVTLLRDGTDRGARVIGRGLATLAVAAMATSVIATVATRSDVALAGDVQVRAERSQWAQKTVQVPAGGAVVVDNADAFRHTFTVEEAGLDVELPAGKARRIVLDVAAGTYTLRCAVPGHEDMLATIEVR